MKSWPPSFKKTVPSARDPPDPPDPPPKTLLSLSQNQGPWRERTEDKVFGELRSYDLALPTQRLLGLMQDPSIRHPGNWCLGVSKPTCLRPLCLDRERLGIKTHALSSLRFFLPPRPWNISFQPKTPSMHALHGLRSTILGPSVENP